VNFYSKLSEKHSCPSPPTTLPVLTSMFYCTVHTVSPQCIYLEGGAQRGLGPILSIISLKPFKIVTLQGLCHEMNTVPIFLRLIIINNSGHALIVFTIFCFLVDEKIKPKFLACSFEIT
jgi:hypothetical protein